MNSDEYNALIGKTWHVTQIYTQMSDMAVNASIRFTSAMTVEVQVVSDEGQPSFVVWGKRCEVSKDGLFGVTDADEKPFVIRIDTISGDVRCDLVPPSVSQEVLILSGLTALFGALPGATARDIASRLRALTDALSSPVAPMNRAQQSVSPVQSSPQGPSWAQTTSNAIFVASDGGIGGRPPVPHPAPNPRSSPRAAARA